MKRRTVVGLLVIVCLGSVAQATWTDVDFTWGGQSFTAVAEIRLSSYNSNSSSGGAFSVELVDGSLIGSIYENQTTPANNLFTTWCVESQRGFRAGTSYYVTIDEKVYGGGETGGDPISKVTEWIYDKWLDAVKNDNVAGLGWQQKDINQAIWYAEGEGGGVKNGLYDQAYDKVGDGNAEHTWAMNLWTITSYQKWFPCSPVYTSDKQSQLITMRTPPVPAPSAIVLSSLGVVVVGWLRRRRFR